MKFAHLADCHIGGWKEEKLTSLGIKVFETALKECINRNVDFILLSGDLFNTALPGIEYIKEVVRLLKTVKDAGINIYTIAGSHDYSISGKTMLDVMENAGLICNVAKFNENGLRFTIDKKTNAKIAGLYGKKGGLEKFDYETLNRKYLEDETGFKIFLFHSGIKEFMPSGMEDVEAISFNTLPMKFNYYAGGHIHYIFQKKNDSNLLMFPGALFPNNFKELEEIHCGGFYVVDDKLNYEYVKIMAKNVMNLLVDANEKSPDEVMDYIIGFKEGIKDKIVTIRIGGVLREGKPSDVNFKKINEHLSDAYCVIRNTSKLSSKEFNIVEVKEDSIIDIEKAVVDENSENIVVFGNYENKAGFVDDLIIALSIEKQEGEKSHTFEDKIIDNLTRLFFIEKK